ncbi:hypothetical protein LEP1GSC060_0933 [Leptospira weilii serovar Ranarum str. ICFT]|uniref:Uncharacterized protein n=1 Tax=Leptospira weilii serovar Ranarum str. ICFT TaxID=1218598 RepID=N1WPE4_9LEPT|nr:hypothetical protein LEP1GSC060_0933 [Leptospira weilii serovar Ranarum str. ICFT]
MDFSTLFLKRSGRCPVSFCQFSRALSGSYNTSQSGNQRVFDRSDKVVVLEKIFATGPEDLERLNGDIQKNLFCFKSVRVYV